MDAVTVGAILAVSFLVATFSSFLGGALSDYIGRYPVMIVSMLLWSLVFLGFSAAIFQYKRWHKSGDKRKRGEFLNSPRLKVTTWFIGVQSSLRQ